MLRIIAGERRGTKLATMEGLTTRPLRDRVREALFNIIQFEIIDRNVLDCFAGSGAVGLEALSRGAAHATFIEDNLEAQNIIRRNIAKLQYADRTTIIGHKLPEALDPLRPENPFDLVFIMPSYNSGLAEPMLERLRKPDFLGKNALLILEIEAKETFHLDEEHWKLRDDRTYGVTRLLFLVRKH